MQNKEYRVNFVCPNSNCNCHIVEEIMVHVTQFSPIMGLFLSQDGSVGAEYANNCSHEGGTVSEYQCLKCGFVLRTEPLNVPVSTPEELLDWLTKQNMLKERP